jgi:hypothetical protein
MKTEQKPLTYRELLRNLQELDELQLDMIVVIVVDENEPKCFPIYDTLMASEIDSDMVREEVEDCYEEGQPVLLTFTN